ncbi:MAG: hypothetical protein KUG72_13590 [Pseudomonadales bacterium]|nr:hypothetical protein [Pseudomonadales bacterium]
MAVASKNLIRKQILVSADQVKKITTLAKHEGTSQAEIVRLAIDAFEPGKTHTADEGELLALVAERLKEAIGSTQAAATTVTKTLKKLSNPQHG